jgi:hypothetical protein
MKKPLDTSLKFFTSKNSLVVSLCILFYLYFMFCQILDSPSTKLIITKNHCENTKLSIDTIFNFFASNGILIVLLYFFAFNIIWYSISLDTHTSRRDQTICFAQQNDI